MNSLHKYLKTKAKKYLFSLIKFSLFIYFCVVLTLWIEAFKFIYPSYNLHEL